MRKIKTTEQGWAGHFICADRCGFRRNTLVECGHKKIIVSTVGAMLPLDCARVDRAKRSSQLIGRQRYYETMVFWAKYDEPYWHADVTREVEFESNWSIDELEYETDLKANQMHEQVVKEIVKKIQSLEKYED